MRGISWPPGKLLASQEPAPWNCLVYNVLLQGRKTHPPFYVSYNVIAFRLSTDHMVTHSHPRNVVSIIRDSYFRITSQTEHQKSLTITIN